LPAAWAGAAGERWWADACVAHLRPPYPGPDLIPRSRPP